MSTMPIHRIFEQFQVWWLYDFSGQSLGTQRRRWTGCWQHWPGVESSNQVQRSSKGQSLSCHLCPPKGQQEVWKRKLKFPVKYLYLLLFSCLVLFVGGWWFSGNSTMRGLSLSSTRSQWFGQGYFQILKEIFNFKSSTFNNVFFLFLRTKFQNFFSLKVLLHRSISQPKFLTLCRKNWKKQH